MKFIDVLIELGFDTKLTGKGETIVLIDLDLNKDREAELLKMGVEIPYKMPEASPNDPLKDHSYWNCFLWKKWQPDARIILLPPTPMISSLVYTESVDLISGSISAMKMADEFINKCGEVTFFVASAGNSGDTDMPYEARLAALEHVTGIGACAKVGNKYEVRDYSSYGLGEVDCVCVDGFEFDYSNPVKLFGTSFSITVFGILSSQFNQRYKQKFGFRAPVKTRYKELKLNSLDMCVPGKDLKTGYGMYNQMKKTSIMGMLDDKLPLNAFVKYDNRNNTIIIVKPDGTEYGTEELAYLGFIARGRMRALSLKDRATVKVDYMGKFTNEEIDSMIGYLSGSPLIIKKFESGELLSHV